MRSTVIGWASRRRGALWGALVLLFAIVGTAGATAGAMLHLGVGNTTSATTTLRSGVNGTVLQVSNTNSTGGTSARGLGITVPAGRPPISVNATAGKATNLDADKLDGLDSSQLQRRVLGSCPIGSAFRYVIEEGGVLCDPTAGQVKEAFDEFSARFGAPAAPASTETGRAGSCMLGEVRLFAGSFAPVDWTFTHGQLFRVDQWPALYGVLGDSHGGDGRIVFALPDARGIEPAGMHYIICINGTVPQD